MSSRLRNIKKTLERQVPRVEQVISEISEGGRWRSSWIKGMRAEAARRGVEFQGREDDQVSPAAVKAALKDPRCMRLFAKLADITRNGGDAIQFTRCMNALTRAIASLGRAKPANG